MNTKLTKDSKIADNEKDKLLDFHKKIGCGKIFPQPMMRSYHNLYWPSSCFLSPKRSESVKRSVSESGLVRRVGIR